jgi:DNA-binding CsgD family transcriptional regulator
MQKLTPREAQVLDLYLREGNLKPVAEVLGVSINTVRSQRTSIMKKLGASSQVGLTLEAVRRGLVDLNVKKFSIRFRAIPFVSRKPITTHRAAEGPHSNK